MSPITRSYLRTFLKNWKTTLGTLLFIVILVVSLLGMVATPIKLQKEFVKSKYHNIAYDYRFKPENTSFSPEYFNFEKILFYNESNKENNLNIFEEEGKWNDPLQEKQDLNLFFSKYVQVNESTFSSIGQKYIQQAVLNSYANKIENNFNFDKNQEIWKNSLQVEINNILKWYNSYGALKQFNDSDIKLNGIQAYSIPSSFQLLTNESNNINENEIKTYLFNSMINIFSYALTDIYINAKNGYSSQEILSNALLGIITKSNAILKPNNKTLFDAKTISELVNTAKNINTYSGMLKFLLRIFNNINFQELITEPDFKTNVFSFHLFTPKMIFELKTKYNNNIYWYLFQSEESKLMKQFNTHLHSEYGFELERQIDLKENFIGDTRTVVLKEYNSDNVMNQVTLQKGKQLSNDNEVVISGSYALANDVQIGDDFFAPSIRINSPLQLLDPILSKTQKGLRVTGIGTKYEDIIPHDAGFNSLIQSTDDFVYAYVSSNFINQFIQNAWNYMSNSSGIYNIVRLKMKNISNDPYYKTELIESFRITDYQVDNSTSEHSFNIIDHLGPFSIFDDASVNHALKNVNIQIIIFLSLGAIMISLAFIFVNFTTKKELNDTRRQLGIFKAMGYKVKELSFIFALKIWIQILCAVIIGFAISIPLQNMSVTLFRNDVTIGLTSVYLGPVFMLSVFVFVPGLFFLLTLFLTIRYLKENPLELMNYKQKLKSKIRNGFTINFLSKHNLSFNYRLRLSFVKRARGKFWMVQIIFAFSTFAYLMVFSAMTLISQSASTALAPYSSEIDHSYYWDNKSYMKNEGGKLVPIMSEEEKEDQLSEFYKKNTRVYDYSRFIPEGNQMASINYALDNWDDVGHQFSESRYYARTLFSMINFGLKDKTENLSKILFDFEGNINLLKYTVTNNWQSEFVILKTSKYNY